MSGQRGGPAMALLLLALLACWTNPKTRVKTDCGKCNCAQSSNSGNHKPKTSRVGGVIFCNDCLEVLG